MRQRFALSWCILVSPRLHEGERSNFWENVARPRSYFRFDKLDWAVTGSHYAALSSKTDTLGLHFLHLQHTSQILLRRCFGVKVILTIFEQEAQRQKSLIISYYYYNIITELYTWDEYLQFYINSRSLGHMPFGHRCCGISLEDRALTKGFGWPSSREWKWR